MLEEQYGVASVGQWVTGQAGQDLWEGLLGEAYGSTSGAGPLLHRARRSDAALLAVRVDGLDSPPLQPFSGPVIPLGRLLCSDRSPTLCMLPE